MKNNYHFSKALLLSSFVLCFSACQKDESDLTQPDQQISTESSTRLKFNNVAAFTQAMDAINKAKDKQEAIRLAVGPSAANFKSISAHNSTSEGKLTASSVSYLVSAADSLQLTSEDYIDELVPDPNFQAVLNEVLEVQVANDIYKITPYGTFVAQADKIEEVDALLATDYNYAGEKKVSEYLYDVQPGIQRYDTYGEAEDNRAMLLPPIDDDLPYPDPDYPTYPTPTPTPVSSGDCFTNPYYPSFSGYLTDAQYCSFDTKDFGAKTIAGKFIESIFGTNSDYDVYYDNTNRVKVKLYNYNYLLFASIGIKVKYQKKGWTGIWDKKDTEKLIIGWDGIQFETPVKYTAPYNYPKMPTNAIAKEIYKFGNFEVVAATITDFDGMVWGLVDNRDIKNALNSMAQSSFKDITKKVWSYVENTLAPQSVEYRDAKTKAFRMIFPTKFTTTIGRWETSKTNDGELDCVFSFNTCQVGYSNNIGSAFDWGKLLQQTLANSAQSYKVKKASIYGAANHDGRWKGLRIVQNQDGN